jgi:hypothetical protein
LAQAVSQFLGALGHLALHRRVQESVVERNRELAGDEPEHVEAIGAESAAAEGVLEDEHRPRYAVNQHRHHQQRAQLDAGQIGIGGEPSVPHRVGDQQRLAGALGEPERRHRQQPGRRG